MVCIVTFSVKQRGCPGGLVGAPSNRRAGHFEVGVPGKSGERVRYGRGFFGFKRETETGFSLPLAPIADGFPEGRGRKDEPKMNDPVRSSSGWAR
jgi:hypothetical protein